MINRKVTDIHMNSVKKLKVTSFMELRGVGGQVKVLFKQLNQFQNIVG